MYKMEQLTSKQMWRGKENCVAIAIKGEHHTETISCVRFCYGATTEEKLRPQSPANVASQICLQPYSHVLGLIVGTQPWHFTFFMIFALWKFTVEFPTGLPATCVSLQ